MLHMKKNRHALMLHMKNRHALALRLNDRRLPREREAALSWRLPHKREALSAPPRRAAS